MNKDTIEFFLHGNGKPQVQSGLEGEPLKDVLARLNVLPGDGEFCIHRRARRRDADDEARTREDTQVPADQHATLGVLRVRELRHVHTRAVRRIEVTVYFNGKDRKRKFSPAATAATVLAWAKKRFKIDPRPAPTTCWRCVRTAPTRGPMSIWRAAQAGSKSLEFDLVREVTPQG